MKYDIEKFSDGKFTVYQHGKHLMNVYKNESGKWISSNRDNKTYPTRKAAIEDNIQAMKN